MTTKRKAKPRFKVGEQVWVTSEGVLENKRTLASKAKVTAVSDYGVQVVLEGDPYDQGWMFEHVFKEEVAAVCMARALLVQMIDEEMRRHMVRVTSLATLAAL